MSNMIVARALLATSGSGATGTGHANLQTPEPKEVWIGAAGAHYLVFDFGAAVTVDTFFLGFIGGGADSTILINTRTTLGGGDSGIVALTLSPATALRRHGFAKLPGTVTSRYWSAYYSSPTVAPQAGIFALGLAFAPTLNREKGGGRTIIDTGTVEERPDGGFGIGKGARKGGFRWTFGDLSDAELDALYDLGLNTGNGDPVIVSEDPDSIAGLHYGLFERFEHYERADPTKHRWGLAVRQWV